ncbi:MarR family transcriptional regulator [Corynebacterium sp. CCM 9185]|uniref:MarR family transcriptional regulator n=1 Tax=Corynebacterium marambiense TaxID=2765364 RepID=A0ABS0VTT8_9CORY|nr:MarR family transcriptional regulator [Corynebacterium marambiense]MBI8999766.1 MarR family transcriptional regulator [Corynebacterium marambiense]MCK7662606.1 MarR family transcriptional regulator [Corynebacterium marambiense]MCX7543614.1 MarR family transcriptional regulator [Corynebacterium marambiense]
MADHIDQIIDQWRTTRPDLDPAPMQLPARLQRLARAVSDRVTDNLTQFNLERWQFDVLATLRRTDRALTAGELCTNSMISGSAMTNRIDKLETAGLLTRCTDPDNRRCVRITLTDTGRKLVDTVLPTHLDTCRDTLAGLTDDEQATLVHLLRKALAAHTE